MTKNCFRCGTEFESKGGRVCNNCRKPRSRGSVTQILTFREYQICDLVAEALLNKEIAWRLSLTEGTIKEYLNRIFKKTGMKNRTELAIAYVTGSLKFAHLEKS